MEDGLGLGGGGGVPQNDILLYKLKGPFSNLSEIQTRMIVLFHDVPELQLTQIEETDVPFVPLVFRQVDHDSWLAKGVQLAVVDVDNLSDYQKLLLRKVLVLEVCPLLMRLLQIQNLELPIKSRGLHVDLSGSRSSRLPRF